ncbi:zf-HC2 domain-containing protein [Dermatophilaceae bacterium Sec6.4]|nr:zf-HC2 domain-containing protein [Actinomycetota bacterium]
MRAREVHGGEVLGDYVDNMLDVRGAGEVERHLAVCQHCRAYVDEQRELIRRLRHFSLGPQGEHDLVAGLMSLAQQVHEQAQPIRRHGPATLHAGAPAQYTSARRSVACAIFAVAGCVGATLVAVQVPVSGVTVNTGQLQRQPANIVRQASVRRGPVAPVPPVSEPVVDPLMQAAMVGTVGR